MNLETSHDLLMSRICSKRENADLARLERAYDMGLRLHKDQKRKSGEPYFIHPIAVAGILADLGLDDDCLIAALLHDTLEDTNVSIDEISAAFGDQVAELVEGCTKIAKLDRVGGLKLEETSTSKAREKRARISKLHNNSLPRQVAFLLRMSLSYHIYRTKNNPWTDSVFLIVNPRRSSSIFPANNLSI